MCELDTRSQAQGVFDPGTSPCRFEALHRTGIQEISASPERTSLGEYALDLLTN